MENQTPLLQPAAQASAFRIVQRIFEFWHLSDAQSATLLSLNNDEWQTAKRAGSLPPHVLSRLSHLLWIARLSTDMYPLDKDLGVAWLRRNICESPFLGSSPLIFMLSENNTAIQLTHHYLAAKFAKWGAVRDGRNELIYLDDNKRVMEEPLDTLLCMSFRITQAWRVSEREECMLLHTDRSLKYIQELRITISKMSLSRMRLLILIDLCLWNIFHEKERVTTWIHHNNSHPLFAGRPPLELLCMGNIGTMKVVHAYLANITP